MRLVRGKGDLINTLNLITTESTINTIRIHGIVDHEILKIFNGLIEGNRDLDVKIICSRINPVKLQLVSRLKNIKDLIKINSQCKCKFILVDNQILFLSGHCNDNQYGIEENDVILAIHNESELKDSLETIFKDNWRTGFMIGL